MPRLFLASALTFLPASFLLAHEGHGQPGSGGAESGAVNLLWHYLTEPQHALVLVALLTIAAAVFAYRSFLSTGDDCVSTRKD